ncbi:MAG TPA: serine/threonine-protein kinase [Blastocatellia bacterium]|nr:serine/threonine-protein kinase [Blastocatellia bacterium]
MDHKRWKEIDAVFERILDVEPEERAKALGEMCAGNDDLRRRVESLLDQEEAAEDFLKSSALAGLAGQMAERMVEGLEGLAPGMQISHYRIESRIGAGGMGEVWKARDERLDRDVAIKVLSPEFSNDPEWARHFEQEAHTVSALNHPNIITIYDFGSSEGLSFIVTELIEGKTLRAYLNDLRVDWRESVPIATQIASALTATHSVGIIHRDIKPENIMVLKNKLVKTLDFGIAKRVNAPAAPSGDQPAVGILTRSGFRPGTLKYMSPEQARGEPLDARTDVFSLGLAMYEMIAGRHPFAGKSDEEIIEALKSNDEIPPVSEAQGGIPAALGRIVTKALRKKREERYSAGAEMLARLELLRSLIEIGRDGKGERLLRARNADQLLTQFVIFHDADPKTLIPLGDLWTIWRFAKLKRGMLERELMRKSLIIGLLGAGWKVLLVVAITMAAAAWMSVSETWEEQIFRDGHTAAVRRAVFSPDGRLLVSVGEDRQVIVWDFAGRARLAAFNDHTGWVTTVEFSPDGEWFVTASADGSVIVWDAKRLAKATTLRGQRGVVRAINFSTDGKTLVTPTDGSLKNIWEVGSWKKLREVYIGGQGQFLLSPDGRWMMDPEGNFHDLINGQVIPDMRPPFFSGITPYSENARPPFWTWAALSPDGKRAISIDGGGFVAFSETSRFQNLQARKLKGLDRAHRDHGRAVAYSPTGRLAASGAEDIVLWDAIGQKKLARLKHPAQVMSLAFAPDGRWLVSAHADGAILTWDTEERELAADFREHSASVEAVAFAPDSKRLASAGEDGSVIVWDTERLLKEAVLLWHPITITAVAFSADGRLLASNDLDGNLAMWEVDGWRRRWAQKAAKRITSESSHCVAISPDARWVATSYGVYESGEGQLVNDFRTEFDAPGLARPTEIRGVAFSADGRWLVSVTARGDVTLRQAGQWQVVASRKLEGKHLVSVSLSPDGRRLVTGEDEGLARLWSVEPLAEIAVVGKHEARIKSVAFSPDGRTIASAGDDKTVCLWDVNRRRLITRVGAHTSSVLAVSFSADGKRLVSGGYDHSTRLHTRRKTLWGWRWD